MSDKNEILRIRNERDKYERRLEAIASGCWNPRLVAQLALGWIDASTGEKTELYRAQEQT